DAASEEGAGADAEADQAAAAAAAEEIEPSSAVRDAALALRRAKAQGVGSHAIVSREDRAAARALDELSADVLRGVEAGEFEPFFQPQICAQTGSLVAFEALARWRHPDRGVLAPGAFMEAAEKLGAIAEIDAQIFGKAIAQVKEWSANGQYLPQLSLNVSTRRICSEEVCKQVFDAEFDEATLCFELLESTFLDGGDAVIFDAIQRLRDLGTVFEVDDFGTGHASILSVMRIKPQRLKLARELVESVATDAASQEMIRSIIDIAKSLEIGVNAEGIETDEQMSMLRELGCDVFQGYLIAKPMAAEDAAKFIRGGSAKAVPR
ncbi:MAG: EAL domain-containing protein, partial [Pseudomonadota bacterium]